MSILTEKELKKLETVCNVVLELPNIKFCGIINQLGRLVAGGLKKGIPPFESEDRLRLMYMQLVLEWNMRNDFTNTLGSIDYSVTKRDITMTITMSINDKIIILVTDPHPNPDSIVRDTRALFGKLLS